MSYQKHTWVSKEIITATNLNHIESGIYNEEQRAEEAEELIRESMSSYVSNTDYATTGIGGVVKVDGETITINSNGVISSSSSGTIDSELSSESTNAVQNSVITNALGNKADSSSLSTVATSGSYNDLTDKPTITGVNDATLTLQKNGTTVATFSANASTDVTANITVSDDFKMGTTRAGATADTLYFVYS